MSPENPTAVQADSDAHETLDRRVLVAPSTLGVDWICQLAPFQCSAKVVVWLAWREYPTATHAVGDVHDTAVRNVSVASAGLGIDCRSHCRPFHCSASANCRPAESMKSPTAVQAAAAVHDTPVRKVSFACRGSRVGWIVHRLPSHRSARLTSTPCPSWL